MPTSSADADSPTTMSMSAMRMVLFSSTTTPLYSTSWTPSTRLQYAGTCIFLIVLAAIFRGLFAVRVLLKRKWQGVEKTRRYVIVGAEGREKETRSSEESKTSIVSGKSDEGNTNVEKKYASGVRLWRTRQDLQHACLDVVIAGVGYLL